MQHHAAEVDKIQRLQQAEAQPEALVNHDSANTIQSLDDKTLHLKSKRKWPSDNNAPERTWSRDLAAAISKNENIAHEVDDHTKEPMDKKLPWKRHPQTVMSSTHPKLFSQPGSSAKAHDNLVKFVVRFVKMVYRKSGVQRHCSGTSQRYTAIVQMRLRDALTVYATQLLSRSVTVVNASASANEKDAMLTLFAAILIQHCKTHIAWLSTRRLSTQYNPTSVNRLRLGMKFMAPPDFSSQRIGLKTNTRVALWDDCGGRKHMKSKVAPPDHYKVELSEYLEKQMTDLELDHIMGLLGATDEIRLLALCVRSSLSRDKSAMRTIWATMSEKDLFHQEQYGYKADIQMDWWSITKFMRDQYEDECGVQIPKFGSVVTLTGSSTRHAQASTCADYIKATWPHTGAFYLDLLDAIHAAIAASDADSPVEAFLQRDLGLSVRVDISDTVATFTAQATKKHLLVELAQQLSWFSSAFTTSPFEEGLAYSSPLFLRKQRGVFEIKVHHEQIDTYGETCWLPLFDNACIVTGFPIAQRALEVGLEIPLELLAGISGARHVVEYEGGLVMKGFSHMLVPVRRQLDRVQWHAVSSPDEDTPLSYHDGISRCKSRAMLHEVGLQGLASLRAIVGWCSIATTSLGSSHANYDNIDYTKANGADSGPRLTGTSFGFQQFGVAALDVRFGLKDGKSHFQRAGPYQRVIPLAESRPVVLHDIDGKRSWLVPATNVMLHIIQHRHQLNPFQVNGKPVSLDTNIPTGSSAKEVLLKHRSQVLYEHDNYTFMDDILNIWSILEFLLAQNISRQREAPGVRIPTSLHESLYGFEFKAVVLEDAPYRLKRAPISKNHGGWSRLIEDIDALVLFANGLGDVILPADGSNHVLCHKWRRVPHGHDYLTTTTGVLQNLFDKAGSRLDRKYLTIKSKLRWHQGSSTLFNACRDLTDCDCTRLQQLVPESAIKSVHPPASIATEGAVIFGRPEPRPAPSLPMEPQILSSLYSQPNVSIAPSTMRRRYSTIDEETENIRQLDLEINELSYEHDRRLQVI
jgi:hypothetical protein